MKDLRRAEPGQAANAKDEGILREVADLDP